MGYIYVPEGVSLKLIGLECGLFAVLIAVVIWMFYHLKHKLDLNYDFGLSLTEQEIHRISNVLAYSWLAISTFFLVTLAVYVIEPARPHYLRVSGVLSLISGIISCIYCLFVSYDCVDE